MYIFEFKVKVNPHCEHIYIVVTLKSKTILYSNYRYRLHMDLCKGADGNEYKYDKAEYTNGKFTMTVCDMGIILNL